MLKNVSVCSFNNNRNYNFFLESVLKNRVCIIYGCALYAGKYGKAINRDPYSHSSGCPRRLQSHTDDL